MREGVTQPGQPEPLMAQAGAAGAREAFRDLGPAAGMHGGRSAAQAGGRRLSAYATRDLTTGSIPRHLWFLAWPQIVSGSLMMLDMVADLVWAGRGFGARAIAGLGAAQSWTMLIMTGRMGLDTASRAMVSRAVGAGNLALANHVALQSFTLSGGFALVMMAVGVLLTEFLLRLLGVSEAVIATGANYMRMQFVASATMGLMWMSGSVLQASGDTLTPMKAQVAARVLHLVLSPLLAFGWLGFPNLGLVGLAAGNVVAQLAGAAWNFWVLFTGRSRLHLTLRGYRVDFPLLWRMVQIGTPASVTSMERSLSQLAVVWLVTAFGDIALAAYSVSQRLMMLTNLGSMGLGQASGILVGQNLGAGRPERARKSVVWALGFVLLMSMGIGGVLWAFAEPLLSIFSHREDKAELLQVAVPWFRIVLIGFAVMGVNMVFMQSFNTAGDTLPPMLTSLATVWGIQVPLAVMLSGAAEHWTVFGIAVPLPTIANLGPYGIAWAMTVAMASNLLVYIPYFIWGPWWKKRVFGRQVGTWTGGSASGAF